MSIALFKAPAARPAGSSPSLTGCGRPRSRSRIRPGHRQAFRSRLADIGAERPDIAAPSTRRSAGWAVWTSAGSSRAAQTAVDLRRAFASHWRMTPRPGYLHAARNNLPHDRQHRPVGQQRQQPRHHLRGDRHAALRRRESPAAPGGRRWRCRGRAGAAKCSSRAPGRHRRAGRRAAWSRGWRHRAFSPAGCSCGRRAPRTSRASARSASSPAGSSPANMIAAEIAGENAHRAKRRRAVAFALVGGDAATPERAGKHRACRRLSSPGSGCRAGRAPSASTGLAGFLRRLRSRFFEYDRAMKQITVIGCSGGHVPHKRASGQLKYFISKQRIEP